MAQDALAVAPLASVTMAVNEYVPGEDGVPDTTPAVASNSSTGGNPGMMSKCSGDVPPDTAKDAL
jgi:hypothetical protein